MVPRAFLRALVQEQAKLVTGFNGNMAAQINGLA
jgi:hypothetical protein